MRVVAGWWCLAVLLGCLPLGADALPARDVRPVNNRDYFPHALDLIRRSQTNIRMIMYLAQSDSRFQKGPVPQLLQALAEARARGVDVAVILERPKGSDGRGKDLAQKNAQVREWLSDRGVLAGEDAPGITTHAKLLVVDKRYTLVGSTNWTYAAMAHNNEASVLIDSPEVASAYTGYFEMIRSQR